MEILPGDEEIALINLAGKGVSPQQNPFGALGVPGLRRVGGDDAGIFIIPQHGIGINAVRVEHHRHKPSVTITDKSCVRHVVTLGGDLNPNMLLLLVCIRMQRFVEIRCWVLQKGSEGIQHVNDCFLSCWKHSVAMLGEKDEATVRSSPNFLQEAVSVRVGSSPVRYH